MRFLASIGRGTISMFAMIGQIARFAPLRLYPCVRPPFYPPLILHQLL